MILKVYQFLEYVIKYSFAVIMATGLPMISDLTVEILALIKEEDFM